MVNDNQQACLLEEGLGTLPGLPIKRAVLSISEVNYQYRENVNVSTRTHFFLGVSF